MCNYKLHVTRLNYNADHNVLYRTAEVGCSSHDLASGYSEALCDVCSRKALYMYTFYLLISLSFRCVLASYMIDELAFKGYYHNHAITSNKGLMKLLPSLNASSDQLLWSSCGCCACWLKECRSLRTGWHLWCWSDIFKGGDELRWQVMLLKVPFSFKVLYFLTFSGI